MIFYLFGPDTFRSRRRLQELVAEFRRQRDPRGYNITWLDGKTITSADWFSTIKAAPFLAAKRLVVVENLLASPDQELLEALPPMLESWDSGGPTVVIFWQGEAPAKAKVVKALHDRLAREKYAQEFALFSGPKLSSWAQQEFKQNGGAIEAEALAYLCQNAGYDMWWLHSLIEQLTAYASGRVLTLSDVQLFLPVKLDDNIFALVDALAAGNRPLASQLLQYQREQGEEEGRIFSLLVWQWRVLLEMADTLEREGNLTSDGLAKRLGLHPYVARKNLAVARRTPLSRLEELYRNLADIDVRAKTGAAPWELLTDLFVAKL
ncbi:MAG: DNA polymerase III subunit delta [Candidatus Magasanikbacteria bacterium]|nr:DNA polymerase III subunit delta [Candidatus Magasanikbacteria bacterium]